MQALGKGLFHVLPVPVQAMVVLLLYLFVWYPMFRISILVTTKSHLRLRKALICFTAIIASVWFLPLIESFRDSYVSYAKSMQKTWALISLRPDSNAFIKCVVKANNAIQRLNNSPLNNSGIIVATTIIDPIYPIPRLIHNKSKYLKVLQTEYIFGNAKHMQKPNASQVMVCLWKNWKRMTSSIIFWWFGEHENIESYEYKIWDQLLYVTKRCS